MKEYTKEETLMIEELIETLNKGILIESKDIKFIVDYFIDTRYKKDENDLIDKIKDNQEIYDTIFNRQDIELETKAKLAIIIEDDKYSNRYVKKIKNVAELSVNELNELDEIGLVVIEDKEHSTDINFFDYYSREEYTSIRERIEEIISDIQAPVKGDFLSEFECFREVLKKLAYNVRYDYSVKEYFNASHDKSKEIYNLYGPIVNGIGVCDGDARALRNTLAMFGIESNHMFGMFGISDIKGYGHAWNQVKLGGEWFNVDLTNSRDEIIKNENVGINVLKSDINFEDGIHDEFNLDRPAYWKECNTSALMMLYKSIGAKCKEEIFVLPDKLYFLSNEELELYLKGDNLRINGIDLLSSIHSRGEEYERRMLLDKKVNISSDERAVAIALTEDKEFIKKCLKDVELNFTNDEKAILDQSAQNHVYHGSKTKGIKKLETRKSTHGKEYVYATPSKELAMVMSIHMTDLNARISGSGSKEDPVIIVERKKGVFDKYLHKDTNVYTLDGSDFYKATAWSGEVVSDKSHDVLSEEHIDDVYLELQKMEQEGTLKLYHYPDRPMGMPKDNSDLISHWLNADNVKTSKKLNELMRVGIRYPNLIGKIITESINKAKNRLKALPSPKKDVKNIEIKQENHIDNEEKNDEGPKFNFNRLGLYKDFSPPNLKSKTNPREEKKMNKKNEMDR